MSFNDRIISEFRENGGVVGGFFRDATLLLLHTTGARTGKARVTPLVYARDGDRFVVAASKAGADEHPDWLYNVRASPEVTIEVGTERLAARATILASGPRRDELYAKLIDVLDSFAGYEEKAGRTIPVLVLEPLREAT